MTPCNQAHSPRSCRPMPSKTLIVCDVQPDVVQKLASSASMSAHTASRFVDMVQVAVAAARQRQEFSVMFTMLRLSPGYGCVPSTHPRLGILRRLSERQSAAKAPCWFTSSNLSVSVRPGSGEVVADRQTILPHANDIELMKHLTLLVSGGNSSDESKSKEALSHEHEFVVIGYGPTVQAVCCILGDVLAVPNVHVLSDCVADEQEDRRQAMLNCGVLSLLFGPDVCSDTLVDFLESTDQLYERITIDDGVDSSDRACMNESDAIIPVSPKVPALTKPKYVCDCGRGGHLSLFLPYLKQKYGYVEWPTQPWYSETKSLSETTHYNCPLGRRTMDLCDEPQFSQRIRFFLAGRQHLDEKDLLHQLVPELMPPTFNSIDAAQAYAKKQEQMRVDGPRHHNFIASSAAEQPTLLWFVKAVNQNGGRAVAVTTTLPSHLRRDEQLQAHVPRPLLYGPKRLKCHVKTYQFISCIENSEVSSGSTDAAIPSRFQWQLYIHDCFYMSTAASPWSLDDTSDDVQITTMRTHRLYPDDPWRVQWNLTDLVQTHMQSLLERAVKSGKLKHDVASPRSSNGTSVGEHRKDDAVFQFEVNSADWMLDESGRMYLIECNGIPVLYDGGREPPQNLVTRGLRLYDKQYQEDPDNAVVNDHDLIKDAVDIALSNQVPPESLWNHVASIPACEE